jgi:hypothetical protein
VAWSADPESRRGRTAVVAADPDRARWNQQSVTSGQLADECGFTDIGGTRPDIWLHIQHGGVGG